MNVYIYAADIYCEDCGKAIRERITEEGFAPKDPEDEYSYDSGQFPKGPYPDGGGESDSPQHCGAGSDCLNAIEFPDGHKIGAWLENELTTDGVKYVREAIQEGGEVAEMWAEFYCDYDLQPAIVKLKCPNRCEVGSDTPFCYPPSACGPVGEQIGLGVLAYADAQPSNRWEDGTIGVLHKVLEHIRESDDWPLCCKCHEEVEPERT